MLPCYLVVWQFNLSFSEKVPIAVTLTWEFLILIFLYGLNETGRYKCEEHKEQVLRFHISRPCFGQHLHPLYLPNTGFCFIHKNVVCSKIFDLNSQGTGINFRFQHLWKQISSWCLDPFGTDQLCPYLLILKRSPGLCLGNGCWCVSISFFTILVPWTCWRWLERWLQPLLVCWFSSCLL